MLAFNLQFKQDGEQLYKLCHSQDRAALSKAERFAEMHRLLDTLQNIMANPEDQDILTAACMFEYIVQIEQSFGIKTRGIDWRQAKADLEKYHEGDEVHSDIILRIDTHQTNYIKARLKEIRRGNGKNSLGVFLAMIARNYPDKARSFYTDHMPVPVREYDHDHDLVLDHQASQLMNPYKADRLAQMERTTVNEEHSSSALHSSTDVVGKELTVLEVDQKNTFSPNDARVDTTPSRLIKLSWRQKQQLKKGLAGYNTKYLDKYLAMDFLVTDEIRKMLTKSLVSLGYKSFEQKQRLIDLGADVNGTDKSGRTALEEACIFGSVEDINFLIKNGARLERQNEAGATPLMSAARSDKLDKIKYLASVGANMNHKNKMGDSALSEAITYDHPDTVKCLVENGADIEQPDRFGYSALHSVAYKGHKDLSSYLIDKGANIEHTRDEDGYSVLCSAVYEGYVDIVICLVKNGANINHETDFNGTPLDIAIEYNHNSIIEILRENGAHTLF